MNLQKTKIYLAFLPANRALCLRYRGDIERRWTTSIKLTVEEGDEFDCAAPSTQLATERSSADTPSANGDQLGASSRPKSRRQADANPDTEPEESIDPIPEVDDAGRP